MARTGLNFKERILRSGEKNWWISRTSFFSVILILICFLSVSVRVSAFPSVHFLADTIVISSDTVSRTYVWDLQQCIDYARANNLQVKSAQLNEQGSQTDLKTAKASRFPSLSFSSGQGFTNGNKINDNGDFVTQMQYTGSYQVSTNMTLYNGGKINHTIRQQESLLEASRLLVEKSRNDIELQVTASYLEVLYAMESLESDSAVLESSRAQLEQAQARYEAGVIAQSEYAQIKAQYETDVYNMVVSQTNLANSRLALKQLLELGMDENVDVVPPQEQDFNLMQDLPSVGDVYQTALQTMPEILASEKQIEASRYAEKVAKAQMIPSISLSAAVGTGYYTSAQYAFLNQLGNNLTQNVNIGITVPIYQRRQAKSSIETAKINIQQSELDLQDTRKQLLTEVEQAYQDAVSAQSRYLAASRQLEASTVSYGLVQEEYAVGNKTLVDLLTEKSTYLASVEEMLKAKYQTVLSIRLLLFYQNRGYQGTEQE